MKNKEIKELLDYYQKEIDKYEETKQYLIEKYGYDEETIDNISQHQKYKNNKLLLSYIEQLEKKAELGEHYKHLYSEVKKQKVDVVEYIKNNWYSKNTRNINEIVIGDWRIDILRMLGEIE